MPSKKSPRKKKTKEKDMPSVFQSPSPVSLAEWRAGKSSPLPAKSK